MNNVKMIAAAFAAFVFVVSTAANAADFAAKATMTWSSDGTSTAKTFAVEGTFTKAVAEYDYSVVFEFVLTDGNSELRSFSMGVSAERYRCDGIPWYDEAPKTFAEPAPRTFADEFPSVPRTFAEEELPPQQTFAEPRTFAEEELPPAPRTFTNDDFDLMTLRESEVKMSESVPRTFTEQALAASRDAARKSIRPMFRSYGPARVNVLSNGAGSATRY